MRNLNIVYVLHKTLFNIRTSSKEETIHFHRKWATLFWIHYKARRRTFLFCFTFSSGYFSFYFQSIRSGINKSGLRRRNELSMTENFFCELFSLGKSSRRKLRAVKVASSALKFSSLFSSFFYTPVVYFTRKPITIKQFGPGSSSRGRSWCTRGWKTPPQTHPPMHPSLHLCEMWPAGAIWNNASLAPFKFITKMWF